MCFYISKHNSNPIIAKEDIECFKIGYKTFLSNAEDAFKSQYRLYIYQLNDKQPELQLEPKHDTELGWDIIHEGYHSYSNLTTAIVNAFSDQVVVKCIIPKGATYYYNPRDEEYVSTSLIVINFLPSIKVD